MDQSDQAMVLSARDEALTRGLIDWVPLQRLHYHTTQDHPGEPVAMIQQRVLDLIRALVDEGLVEIGDLDGADDRFAAWTTPLDESIARIASVYVDGFDEDTVWPWYAWLNLTAKGDTVAEQINSSSSG
jgi:hypothetical protein